MTKAINAARNLTPLWLRVLVGPYVAWIAYRWNMTIRKNQPQPRILSLDQTLDHIKNDNLSAIRFGDGEISAIEHYDLGFQVRDANLAAKLKEILMTNDPSLLICIPNLFGRMDFLTKKAFRFELHHMFKQGAAWRRILSYDQTYGDAFITRPYLNYKDKSQSAALFSKLFSIWAGRDVILIEGAKSRLGVGNDMFAHAMSVKRILCPARNAFAAYDAIRNSAEKMAAENPDAIILLSVGPTAKVLAYDLWKQGHRVIDIGHIDMEYEMFLRKSDHLIAVPHKHFSELGKSDKSGKSSAHDKNAANANEAEFNDQTYQDQIVATIS
jgi:glycosyltransferase family protein